MGRKLVAYFSAGGVTALAAYKFACAIDADVYRIRPQRPYTAEDLDWRDAKSRTSVERDDSALRPAIEGAVPDMARYDAVYIGFPIWWYTAPAVVKTFLEACRFNGQKLVLFATSAGGGMGDAPETLASCCPGAEIRGVKMMNGFPNAEAMRTWAESTGITD